MDKYQKAYNRIVRENKNKVRPIKVLSDEAAKIIIKYLEQAHLCCKAVDADYMANSIEKDVTKEIKSFLVYFKNNCNEFDIVGSFDLETERDNYNGTETMKPDLVLHLSDDSRDGIPVTIEAKFIDSSDIGYYCRKGTERFVNGGYAWEAREGFMIAYIRDEATLERDFRSFLTRNNFDKAKKFSFSTHPKLFYNLKNNVACSMNNRNFNYIFPPFKNPGAIKLWHVWLN